LLNRHITVKYQNLMRFLYRSRLDQLQRKFCDQNFYIQGDDGHDTGNRRFWPLLTANCSTFVEFLYDGEIADSNVGKMPQISNFEN